MKKEDLKSGMIVETRSGKLGMVLLDTAEGDIIGGGTNITDNERMWMPLNSLSDDLTYTTYPGRNDADIVKVYKPTLNNRYGSFDVDKTLLVWERKETIELSFEEIAKRLGIDPKQLKIIKK